MKTLVLVSYHFPPYGGKAVQRASKLVKYLPSFGWKPVVFTMPLGEAGVPVDGSLLDELPDNIEIHRPPFRDLWRLVPHDIRKYLYYPLPDKYISWAKAVGNELVSLISRTSARALISTSPTHSAQLLGLEAKKRTGIPWIADFRDPWSGHPDFPQKKHADRMYSMETDVVQAADAVVGVYPKILRDFEGRIPKEKMRLVENGFDDEDFSLIDRGRKAADGPLRIGYNGTVSDFHDPRYLLEPLEELAAAGRLDPGSLCVEFSTGEGGRKRFDPYRTLRENGILIIHDYIPHAESLARLADTDVSLHLLTRGSDIYPGKIFEYFYLGNPLLSLSLPGDDLHRLIDSSGTGTVVDYRNREAVTAAVINLMEKKRDGSLPHLTKPDESVMRFSRRNIAARYAEILNEIAG